MATNDGDGILLNLTSTDIEECAGPITHKKSRKKRNILTKKPRTAKRSTLIESKTIRADNRTDNQKSKELENESSSEKFQVISSLFRKNPELPDISSDVCQSKEPFEEDKTFSGSEFRDTSLTPFMISNLEKNLQMSKMTSVQKASLPSLLGGKDVFINSPTGTGKTLSYVIPVVQSLQAICPKIQRGDGPYCLVIVPTRELASQTFTVIQQVLKPFIWIVPGCVTGGEKRKSEKARLRKGVNILVATPGRLVDHLKTTQCLAMSQLRWLVLDEADRLLDLGFEQDISFIISIIKDHTSRKVQKVLLSATLSQGVENLLDVNFESPVTINMVEEKTSKLKEFRTPNLLEQFCVIVPMKLRLVTLAAFLQDKYQENCKIIVFFTTQDSVDFHFMLYSSTLTTVKGNMLKFMKLHGKMSQNERSNVFSEFKSLNKGILLCTDVAARGLDLPSINWIVQYNPPVTATDYIHRVGRTARIGMSGQAVLFLLPTEVSFLNILREQNIRLNELKMNDILTKFVRSLSEKPPKVMDEEHLRSLVTEEHMKFEERVCWNNDLKYLSLTAFRSFIGAYNTFPTSVKHIFHSRNLHLGHLAKSFALRETPSELKLAKDVKERRPKVTGDTRRRPSGHASSSEPSTKKLKKR